MAIRSVLVGAACALLAATTLGTGPASASNIGFPDYLGCEARIYNTPGPTGTPLAYSQKTAGSCTLQVRIYYKLPSGLTKYSDIVTSGNYAAVTAPAGTTLVSSTHWIGKPGQPLKAFYLGG